MTPTAFADLIGEDYDLGTDVMIANAGPNEVYCQAHNRGHLAINATSLNVILLVAPSDAVGTAAACRRRGPDPGRRHVELAGCLRLAIRRRRGLPD